MVFGTVEPPLGSDAEAVIHNLLVGHLRCGHPDFRGHVHELVQRLYADLNRLPWTPAILSWLQTVDPSCRAAFREAVQETAWSPDLMQANGAVLLMTALAEQGPEMDDALFAIAEVHTEESVRRIAAAYLLANGRTRKQALKDLVDDPRHRSLVSREQRLEESLSTLRQLVAQDEYRTLAPTLITQHPDLLVDLENGFLDVFDGATSKKRLSLVQWVLSLLLSPEEVVQTFALDLLTEPLVREKATDAGGYRLARRILRLAESPRPATRGLARSLLAMLAGQSSRRIDQYRTEVRVAARGGVNTLGADDLAQLIDVVAEARREFAQGLGAHVHEIEECPGWNPTDYAHHLFTRRLPEPSFPVPVEDFCPALGISLHERRMAGSYDGLLLQLADLPGPVVVINAGILSSARRRFTIAHEIGHAIIPWHSPKRLELTTVEDATTAAAPPARKGLSDGPMNRDPMETEADRFASALLMPPGWFGRDAQQISFDLEGLSYLKEKYGVSLSAAAFNAILYTREAVALAYTVDGRRRYVRMTDEFRELVGWEGHLVDQIHAGTLAYDLLQGESVADGSRTVSSHLWMTHAALPQLKESSFAVHPGHMLHILEPMEDEA